MEYFFNDDYRRKKNTDSLDAHPAEQQIEDNDVKQYGNGANVAEIPVMLQELIMMMVMNKPQFCMKLSTALFTRAVIGMLPVLTSEHEYHLS